MKTVLIIDDDVKLQDLYKQSIEEAGYRVIQAYSAKEGLLKVAENNPDLILLDLMMPGGMNGFDVLERLKRDKNLSKLKIIILTNLPGEEQAARSLGVHEYLLKSDIEATQLSKYIKKQFSWFSL